MRFGPPAQFARRPDGHNLAYQVVGDAPLDLVVLFGWPSQLGLLWENPSLSFSNEYELASAASISLAGAAFLNQERVAIDRLSTDFARSVVQSRMASLMASLSVRLPAATPVTLDPNNLMRKTFNACRRMSSVP